jgi:uncharacterized protein
VVHSLPCEWAGERFVLRADRSLYWPAQRALLVADVHLGKATSFRRLGVPVPTGPSLATLARLSLALQETQAERLLVLGDLVHAARSLTPRLREQVAAWRGAHAQLLLDLVLGNHDRAAGELPQEWRIACVEEPLRMGAVQLRHAPPDDEAHEPTLAGHVHPAAFVAGGFERLRLPCFHFGTTLALLPAFGEFTGAHVMPSTPPSRVFVTTGDEVRALHF